MRYISVVCFNCFTPSHHKYPCRIFRLIVKKISRDIWACYISSFLLQEEYILDSFTEYLHTVPITPLTLSKKHTHKNVKAHYIAYKEVDEVYLKLDDNHVNTVTLAEVYPAKLIFWCKASLKVEIPWDINTSKLVAWWKPVYLNKAFKEKVAHVGSKGTKCRRKKSKVTVRKGRRSRKGKPSKTKKTAISKRHSSLVEETLFLLATSSSSNEDDKDVYEPSDLDNNISYSTK